MSARGCDPKDIALKSFFLGPQAENGPWASAILAEILSRWFRWRRGLFPGDGRCVSESDQRSSEFKERRECFEFSLHELLTRFEDEIPKFSPRYIGHMFSEISLPALFGHIVALLHNPNNVSGEASRVGVKIEDEAVGALLEMVGYSPKRAAGHFTSGGSIANDEALLRARARLALWLAAGALAKQTGIDAKLDFFTAAHMGWEHFERLTRELGARESLIPELRALNFVESNPWDAAERLRVVFGGRFAGPVVLIPENKHYSWQKGVSILGLGGDAFWPVELDAKGKLSVKDLARRLELARKEKRPVLMVVSVAGTTELGEIDPVREVQGTLDRWKTESGIHIWHHIDAAYGGFFCALDLEKEAPGFGADLKAIARAESVTLDPHKLGYVPYSSGAFLVRERRDYAVRPLGVREAPYLQFDVHHDRGPLTVEGSRSAAGAVATWMTSKTIGFNPEGYGRILGRTIHIRKKLEQLLLKSGLPVRIAPYCETNILCFAVALENERLSASNRRTLRVYDAFSALGSGPFFVSMTRLGRRSYSKYLQNFLQSWHAEPDAEELVLVRLCLMNPFFDNAESRVNYPELFVKELRKVVKAGKITADKHENRVKRKAG